MALAQAFRPPCSKRLRGERSDHLSYVGAAAMQSYCRRDHRRARRSRRSHERAGRAGSEAAQVRDEGQRAVSIGVLGRALSMGSHTGVQAGRDIRAACLPSLSSAGREP
jgi:hypothetical protein